MLPASMKTLTSPYSSTVSSSQAPASRPMWYLRPAQPPSATWMRNPWAAAELARTRWRVLTAESVSVTMKPVSFRRDLSDWQEKQFPGHLQLVDSVRSFFEGPLGDGTLPTEACRKPDKFTESKFWNGL